MKKMTPTFVVEEAKPLPRRLRYYFDVISLTVWADLAAEHYRKFLGVFWFLLTPIFSTIGYYILIHFIFGYSTGSPYIVFLLIGTTFWGWFTEALSASTSLVLSSSSIISSIRFPIWVFVFTQNLRSFFFLMIKILVIFMACLLFGIKLDWLLIYLPLVLLVQLSVNICMTPFLAIIGTFFRDIGSIIGYGITLLMFMSPVIYEADKIPKVLQPVLAYNPFMYILPAYRDIFLNHKTPDFSMLFLIFAVCMIFFAIGMYFLNKMRPYFYRFF